MEYKKLFDAEYKVMQIVWDNEPFTSRELAEICFKKLGWKKSTTYTMVKKLSQKGYLKNENVYADAITLRVKLHELVIGENSKFFKYPNYSIYTY